MSRERSIHECKVTLKSAREETSPIAHDKFCTWIWQVQAYCYAFKCRIAFLHVLHLMGDYGERPHTPQACVHRLEWTEEELAGHWAWMMQEAKARKLWDMAKERDSA